MHSAMVYHLALLVSLLVSVHPMASQNVTPRARYGAGAWFSEGQLWIFGGIVFYNASSTPFVNDLWKFDSESTEWSWIRGSKLPLAESVFGAQGISSSTAVPGARYSFANWADYNGDLWVFGREVASLYYNDLWRYKPATNEWTWMGGEKTSNTLGIYSTRTIPDDTTFPGARVLAAYASNANGTLFYMFGGDGYNEVKRENVLPDLWRYNVEMNQWTWLSGNSTGRNLGNNGTLGIASGGIPGNRQRAHIWVSDDYLWIFAGYGQYINTGIDFNDFWRYNLNNDTWTWLGGYSGPGDYGEQEVPNSNNWPGSRVDGVYWTLGTALYLFGGEGWGENLASDGVLNDLWKYDTLTYTWTWMHGSSLAKQSGSYIVVNGSTEYQYPGSRKEAVGWTDRKNGLLWLFGGYGLGSVQGDMGMLNDLWMYNVSNNRWRWIAGSEFINQVGDFCANNSETNPVTNEGCTLLCGNGRIEGGEECESGSGCVQCYCQAPYVVRTPLSGCTLCGNMQLDDSEQCDGSNNCQNCTCIDGTTSINGECSACGNGVVDSGEECDGGTGCLSTCACDETQQYQPLNPVASYCNSRCKIVMSRIKPHVNIVALYGYSIHENDTVYVVMEYCAQLSMDKLLYDSQKPLPLDQKILWIKQIAAGLNHLHENQVIHRDIAARNILMSNNVAKLSDFGMSRHLTMDKGMTKSEVGPLRWMAPESIRDRVYSSKTDVWMFGCCVYEILIQKEPHLNGDAIQVAIKIQNENLTPEVPENLGTNMATLLQSCWSPIPADRPSMADIIAHL